MLIIPGCSLPTRFGAVCLGFAFVVFLGASVFLVALVSFLAGLVFLAGCSLPFGEEEEAAGLGSGLLLGAGFFAAFFGFAGGAF